VSPELGATSLSSSVALNFVKSRAPTATDDSANGYSVGSFWTDQVTKRTWICHESTTGGAVWIEVGTVAPSGPEPPAIAGQGYQVVFEDDFDTLDTNIWRLGAWYIAERPANYTISNSILTIAKNTSNTDQRDIMTKAGYAWTYGYFEARMRYTQNVDVWASTWMMSDQWISGGGCGTAGVMDGGKICEFDMLEANHQFESPLTWRSHFGASHANTPNGQAGGSCGVGDQTSPFSNNWTADTGMQTAGIFRTFAGLWTPTTLKWYVDDVYLKQYPTPISMNKAMRWFLGCWSHNNAANLTTEVDWCRVWQQI